MSTRERREGLRHAGLAHERDSASDKCTMMNPLAQRHLRDVPSAPVVHSFSEVPRVAAPERSSPAQPGTVASLSLGKLWAFKLIILICRAWGPDLLPSIIALHQALAEQRRFLDILDIRRKIVRQGKTLMCVHPGAQPGLWGGKRSFRQ